MIGLEKSPDAFRTISEVADDLDLPQHVLRFWETRFTPIRPLKRGGGRRYYRPDDVDLLKGIRHLLYGQGYTIKGVQRILKQDGLRFVQALGRGEQKVAPGYRPGPDDEASSGETSAEELADAPRDYGPSEPPSPIGTSAVEGETDRPFARIPPDAAMQLRAALDELMECRRILGTLKAE